jgi:hypothetical protein
LVRRHIANEYYALTDGRLIGIPFLEVEPRDGGHESTPKREPRFDLAAEMLVKAKSLEDYGSVQNRSRATSAAYETVRQQRKQSPVLFSVCSHVISYQLSQVERLLTDPEPPEELYVFWMLVERRYRDYMIHVVG